MNNYEIIVNVEQLKKEETLQVMGTEEQYTIPMPDFFKMPDIDFVQLAREDRDIRVLFN